MIRRCFKDYGVLTKSDRIKHRSLPKRCFELSQSNIESVDDTGEDASDFFKTGCQSIAEKCKTSEITVDELQSEISNLVSKLMRESPILLDSLIKDLRELTFEQMLEKRNDLYKKLVERYENDGI